MPKIQILDPAIANKIAAGEVVERPASVVKELVENSLDAGASRVDLEIEEGGKNLIRVTDDGMGMEMEDLPLAFASHATSKLKKPEDLFAIATMGFRGEALASVGSVSQARIVSRARGRETGGEIECQGGAIGLPRASGSNIGTLVEVRNLFFNVPVRRKFLKSTASETASITDTITRMALAFPGVHFRLVSNGKEVFNCPSSERQERIRQFYGRELAESLLQVESRSPDLVIEGYAALPAMHRANRSWQLLFLNGRFIQDRSINHAMNEAYRGLLPEGRFPILFLFLEMSPAEVDVNAHPTKIEVRFRNAWSLYGRVLSALRQRVLSDEKVASLRVEPEASLFGGEAGPAGAARPDSVLPGLSSPTSKAPGTLAVWPESGKFSGLQAFPEIRKEGAGRGLPGRGSFQPEATGRLAGDAARGEPKPFGPPDQGPGSTGPSSPAASAALGPPSSPQADSPGIASRVFLQIHDSYIVVETPDGFVVVDQHALHERILYCELQQRVRERRVESQQLLLPEPVELTPRELAVARELLPVLGELGLVVEDFGPRSVVIQAVPSFLESSSAAQLLHDVLSELGEGTGPRSLERARERILATMACKGAIKFGRPLKPEEIASLLERSAQLPETIACAHGRPTKLAVNLKDLERQFGRK